MRSQDPDTLVRKFVDGELSDEELQQALHRIADDSEARTTLQFELEMRGDLAASRAPRPAPDFSVRTMEAVSEASATEHSLRTWLANAWRTLTSPRPIPIRPAYTLVALLLAGLVAWIAWPSSPTEFPSVSSEQTGPTSTVQQTAAPSDAQQEPVLTRFVYTADDAESVAVAGDFTQWEPIPLSPRTVNGETIWTGLIPVPRGEHEYQFVINGNRWVADPLAPVTRDDGFGAQNAVLKL